MKKQTKQSRQTARRKARQGRAWELFKRYGTKYNWEVPDVPFVQLSESQKFTCMKYYKKRMI